MFSLIIMAIAIVIVVVLAVATMWYGGTIFHTQGGKAEYARYLQQGAQIQGAMKFMEGSTGLLPTGTSSEQLQALLDGKYLSSVPAGNWVVYNYVAYKPLNNLDHCKTMNTIAGLDVTSTEIAAYNGCPPCTDKNYSNYPGCQFTDALSVN